MNVCPAENEILFGEVLDNWLRSIRPTLKRTTCSAYETIIKRHIKPELGNVYAELLTDADIERFLEDKKTHGDPLSPSTLRGIASVLRSAVGYGVKYGCKVHPESCKCGTRPRKIDVVTLSDVESAKIVSVLEQDLCGKALGVLICLNTGLRIGEVCALKWGDISLENGTLSVNRTISRIRASEDDENKTTLYFGEPKSHDSRRTIPLPPSLLDILRDNEGEKDCFVLSGTAKKPVEPRCMQRYFKTLLQQAGVRDMNFHALRHTFATRCVDLGFDVKALSMILGHSDVSITMNTYVHPSFERLRAMMTLLDGGK